MNEDYLNNEFITLLHGECGNIFVEPSGKSIKIHLDGVIFIVDVIAKYMENEYGNPI